MKKVFLSLFSSVLSLAAFSTTYTVDNSPGAPSDFAVFGDAMTAAIDGDTIYVQPSETTYGTVSINKSIVLLGAGHNPEFSTFRCHFDNVYFYTASSGSIIKGIYISNLMKVDDFQTVSNIVVSHSFLTGQNVFGIGSWGSATSWIFENNVIYSTSNWLSVGSLIGNSTFRNNLFCHVSSTLFYGLQPGTIFDHNTFVFGGNSDVNNIFGNAIGIEVTNNIIYITSPTTGSIQGTCNSCNWDNNMTYSLNTTLADLPGNNLNNVDPLFVNVPDNAANFQYSNDYHLTALSPAIDAGSDGTDIGLTGGIGNFNMNGFDPSLPRIGEVTLLNATVPVNGTLNIHVRGYASGN